MSESQAVNTLQQFIERSIQNREKYLVSLREKLTFLESWDINDGDRLHKIQRIHLLHTWSADVLNEWKKWLMDVNRVATFSEEETNHILKFFYELSMCVITFELGFSDTKMSGDINKMREDLKANNNNIKLESKKSYVV